MKKAAARSPPFAESIPESCPVGDQQSHSSIEVSVRELKRQMRPDRVQLERRLGVVLANDDTILAWIPTFSGDVISRCRRGEDPLGERGGSQIVSSETREALGGHLDAE